MTRSYSITNESDQLHTSNGRCPSYALAWSPSDNEHYWPEGHDYFLGNGVNIDEDDETKELREILSKRLANKILTKHILFCDLDGVLADFEQGIVNTCNKTSDQLNPSLMWRLIRKSDQFFENLPWTRRGRELWNAIQQYHPIILTGVPDGNASFVAQKKNWCKRELGEHVQVITCLSRHKHKYCLPYSILIDDRIMHHKPWNEKGGKFILYDEDYVDSIVERIDRHMESDLPSP